MTATMERTFASAAELLAAAAALEAEAARRYRYLAAWWEAQGDRELTALFDQLAQMEQAHLAAVQARRPGAPPDTPHAAEHPLPPCEDADWRSALLTQYRALSFAVRQEERAFAFFTEVAAHAPHPAVRALAEELAGDELEHAAMLRQARRVAFHRERTHAPPPLPADVPALRRQSAAWEAEAAAATSRPARLFALSRNVERYLAVAELTRNEAVLIAAQHLAAETLQQLVAMRDGSDAL